MNPLYRSVMAVLEAAHIPASVRADVDHIFHNPPAEDAAEGYNPDDYVPPNQYPAWIAAGSPTHDELGRELDVRGQLTGGDFSPYPNPDPPPAGGGGTEGERSPEYSNLTNPAGLWNTGCIWRNGFSYPASTHKMQYSVPAGGAPYPQATLNVDNPNADVSVAIGLVGQEPQSYGSGDRVPTDEGSYEITLVCQDTPNTREHGAAANVSFFNG